MKYFFSLFMLTVLLDAAMAQSGQNNQIIPMPAAVTWQNGYFPFSGSSIVVHNQQERKLAETFNYFLKKRFNTQLAVTDKPAAHAIVLETAASKTVNAEAYQLTVEPRSVHVAGTREGVFYGLQSLLQAIQPSGSKLIVPAMKIQDQPAFAYRGLMLDVARHFFSVDEIKKVLDLMACYKLNRLHWHLTDDQGWRLEIKKYPLLTSVSAWRDSTIIGGYGDRTPFLYDGVRTGGFYTQEQARDVVAYAAARGITVVPEIEMPGHSTAVLAAYPNLGNGASSYQVAGFWGVHPTIYNPGPETLNFLKDVLSEVISIFPSTYIHVGGDEVPKTEWKASALAQSLIKEHQLKDENELQSWFIKQIENYLNSKGRKLIGWDEILEGGLAPGATVMSWRGEQGGIEAAKQGHDVVMTPGGYMYLDHAQSKDQGTEPISIGGFLPLKTVYNYNPVPPVLSADQQRYILGVQGNLWTEYIATNPKLEYMLFPRVFAVAEVGWTRADARNFNDFNRRLPAAFEALDKFDVFYRIPEADVQLVHKAPRDIIQIKPALAGAKVYYTLDGRKVDLTSQIYRDGIPAPAARDKKPVVLRYIIVNSDGRTSAEYSVPLADLSALH